MTVFNSDPEFQLCARFWDGTLEFGVGEKLYTLRMNAGKVTGVEVAAHEQLSEDGRHNGSRRVRISAPEHDWEKIVTGSGAAVLFGLLQRQRAPRGDARWRRRNPVGLLSRYPPDGGPFPGDRPC